MRQMVNAIILGTIFGLAVFTIGSKAEKSPFLTEAITSTSASTNKGFNFQLNLNNLLLEQNLINILYLEDVYDGRNTSSSSALLTSNNNDIANLLSTVYGNAVTVPFLAVENSYSTEYVNYAKALKTKNTNAAGAAKNNLISLNSQLGNVISELSPQTSEATITNLLNQHTDFILQSINDYQARDPEAVTAVVKNSSDQSVTISNYISSQIINSNPSIFK